ncbi:1093_t:CDS:2, partial [Cetraspora pellucida]
MKQKKDEDEDTSNDSSSVKDFVKVENLIVHTRKEIQKTRKPIQYQQCQNTNHNKAGCEAWQNDK